jgi:hypothetical protein
MKKVIDTVLPTVAVLLGMVVILGGVMALQLHRYGVI